MLTQIKAMPESIKLRHVATFFDYPPSHFTESTGMQWLADRDDLGPYVEAHLNFNGLPFTLQAYEKGDDFYAVAAYGVTWTDEFMYATGACPAWALGWDEEDESLAEAPVVEFDESLGRVTGSAGGCAGSG